MGSRPSTGLTHRCAGRFGYRGRLRSGSQLGNGGLSADLFRGRRFGGTALDEGQDVLFGDPSLMTRPGDSRDVHTGLGRDAPDDRR